MAQMLCTRRDRTAGRSLPRAVWLLIALASVGAATAGCRPYQSATQYCTDAPCAAGLECVEGVCLPPLPQPEPVPPCESIEECSIDGSADGRDCIDGACVWTDCVVDAQCGTRICDSGACTPRELCVGDADCKDGRVCVDGTCRAPCMGDADCGQGLLPQVCLEGRCEQTCVIDLLCFGGICEGGICEEAECGVDGDCPGENQACTGGRCEGYTPCDEDDDCFDPDFLCNDLGRCEARPTCVTDAECGPAFLCLGDVCRPAQTCFVADECPTLGGQEQECIAGRCVSAPACRSNDDCDSGQVCATGSCIAPPPTTLDHVIVETAHGPCHADGAGACALSLYDGELTTVRVGMFDANDRLIASTIDVSTTGAVVAAAEGGDLVSLVADAPGSTSLSVTDGSGTVVHDALSLTVVDGAGGDALRVLVVDADTGAALANATATVGDTAVTTDASGIAAFATAPAADAQGVVGLTVSAIGHVGFVALGVTLAGNLRVVLPAASAASGNLAGVSANVVSTGDEIGPVGYGIQLVGQRTVHDASLERLFGGTFTSQLTAPIIGALPIALPAAVQLEATLPFSTENQIVRDRTYGTTSAGRRAIVGFELRREVGDLIGGTLGASATDVALNLATDAEGMDALVSEVGDVPALPSVPDVDDIDGDGDLAERMPDWANLPSVEVSPSRKPAERVGVVVNAAPANARGRLFVVGGLELPGLGFVPTGMATLGGGSGTSEQLRVVQPSAGQAYGQRVLRVQAVYDNVNQRSAVVWRGASFSESINVGSFLVPPEGSFVLDDVPTVGSRTLVLASAPGATTYAARVASLEGEHLVLVPSTSAGGRSVPLPATLTGAITVLQTSALRRPGASAEAATSTFLLAGTGPEGDVLDRAEAVSTSIEAAGATP